jgi:DNA helicase-2/ATP-dependent DNA helicase PcrA
MGQIVVQRPVPDNQCPADEQGLLDEDQDGLAGIFQPAHTNHPPTTGGNREYPIFWTRAGDLVDTPSSNHYNRFVIDFVEGLNIQQQQAVMAPLGPVLVLAGPGSGKTRVLTHRIAYLIANMGVHPYNILAVTFTNKAAREMERRVQELLVEQTRGLSLGTFHGICARILRREADQLPVNANYVIFDADDQHSLVKQAIKDLNLDEKLYRPYSVHAAISNAKNELKGPDEYPISTYRDEVIKRIFQRYQELLLSSNAVDFDDLLLYTANLLENFPQVRERYARRFEHVLVDEFQDTNMAQYLLLEHLSSFHHNIFVVGDTDQSIYRWRGADYRNVLRFEKDHPDAQVILLEQNYRSTQNILDVAMAVIDRNPYRTHKQLFTERGLGQKITVHEAYNDQEEALFIVENIAMMVARKQAEPGDFAVMYRTNAQSRVLEEAFVRANLPYKIVGAQRFYGRREIKDLIAFLRLTHNPNDEVSLLRVINVPTRGIGNKTIQSMRTLAQQQNVSPGALLLNLGYSPDSSPLAELSGRANRVLSDFGSMLAGWQAVQEASILELLDRVLADTGYRDYIDDGTDEGRDRWENVLELRRLAAERIDRSLEIFLEEIALVSDQDTLENATNVPTLLTLHAAKGLEFPNVFIAGLNDGTLPHSRSFEDPEAMMEERRLFYVGITRAKDHLFLIYSQVRNTFGYPDYADPSRFLEDIPPQLLVNGKGTSIRSRETFTSRSSSQPNPYHWENAAAQSAPVIEPTYQPGMRVNHPSWGEGLVLNNRIQDGDEIVDIFFEEVGLKRVVASLAKLEIVRK